MNTILMKPSMPLPWCLLDVSAARSCARLGAGGARVGRHFHRIFSAVLGLLLAVAGLGASDYIPTNFKGDTLLSGTAAVFVPGVLMLSAFYMGFRFLKFAATGKKAS